MPRPTPEELAREILLSVLDEVPQGEGDFSFDGKWYVSRFECDMPEVLLETLASAIQREREVAASDAEELRKALGSIVDGINGLDTRGPTLLLRRYVMSEHMNHNVRAFLYNLIHLAKEVRPLLEEQNDGRQE